MFYGNSIGKNFIGQLDLHMKIYNLSCFSWINMHIRNHLRFIWDETRNQLVIGVLEALIIVQYFILLCFKCILHLEVYYNHRLSCDEQVTEYLRLVISVLQWLKTWKLWRKVGLYQLDYLLLLWLEIAETENSDEVE